MSTPGCGFRKGLIALAPFLILSWPGSAQTISGVVTDTSGAAVPNASVETKSPALIEQSRKVTTDSGGRYQIVNLLPGTYSVTATNPGFNTVTRAGIELTTDFEAQVNIELKVGAQNQAVTISDAAPVVDVQSANTPEVMTRSTLDALPSGRSPENVGILIPGASLAAAGSGAIQRDVGGTDMMNQSPLIFHGSADTEELLDGFRRIYLRGGGPLGNFNGVYINEGAIQEMSFGTGAENVDFGVDGMRTNLVPRDGGNQFHATFVGSFSNSSFVGTNLDSHLASLGFTVPEFLKKQYDINPTVTGPIKRNKLWYSASYRDWGVTNTAPVDYNTNPNGLGATYIANAGKPAQDPGYIHDVSTRVTWQIDTKDKISFFANQQERFRQYFGISATTTPDAAQNDLFPSYSYMAHWTRIQNSHLVFDAGYMRYEMQHIDEYENTSFISGWCWPNIHTLPSTPPAYFNIKDSATGYSYNTSAACSDDQTYDNEYLGNAQYVTGAHVIKFGMTLFNGESYDPSVPLGYASYTYFNGAPNSVTLTLPKAEDDKLKADIGIYFQDKWTIGRRLTVNYGVRFDQVKTGWPTETLAPNPFTPAATFPAVGTFLNWKDVSPRIGVAYDPFGKGKTAIKFSFSRFDVPELLGTTGVANPVASISTTETLTWKDLDGSGTVFNPGGFTLKTNELGPSSNANFGKLVQTTTVDPKLQTGWFKRPYVYEYSLGAQHQLFPGVAVTGDYYYRWTGNQIATENTAINNTDFSGPFCVTAPTNALLAGGGGYQVCNLYDLNPNAVGKVQNLVTSASNLGTGEKQHSSGFDLTMVARLAKTTVQGGISWLDVYSNTCGILTGIHPAVAATGTGTSTPESAVFPGGAEYCNTNTGFHPDIKFVASHNFRWGLTTSATYQNATGAVLTSSNPYTSASIAPILGRPLSAGATATKTINLIEPNTIYGPRLNQLDLRLSKRLAIKERFKVTLNADLYNVTNDNYPIAYVTTFSTIGKPSSILSPRLFKIGGRFDF